jgi:hypothetical protein
MITRYREPQRGVLERGHFFQSVTQDGFVFNESADAGTHLSVLGA